MKSGGGSVYAGEVDKSDDATWHLFQSILNPMACSVALALRVVVAG